MNIFFLSKNARECAIYHCNKHVVKMILEYAQILCTTHRLIDGIDAPEIRKGYKKLPDDRESILYKPTHPNHPSVVWTRQSVHHYRWLFELYSELSMEYTHRYHKTHASWTKLHDVLCDPPRAIANAPFICPPPAMPDQCKVPESVVESYRKYYRDEKRGFCVWTNRPIPEWF